MDLARNVFGEPLVSCSDDPMTGFFRDGCCNTSDEDLGRHTVCTRVTREFLEFSRSRGERPVPRHARHSASRACVRATSGALCAARWQEALDARAATAGCPAGHTCGDSRDRQDRGSQAPRRRFVLNAEARSSYRNRVRICRRALVDAGTRADSRAAGKQAPEQISKTGRSGGLRGYGGLFQ